jgi:hypothetical protein
MEAEHRRDPNLDSVARRGKERRHPPSIHCHYYEGLTEEESADLSGTPGNDDQWTAFFMKKEHE